MVIILFCIHMRVASRKLVQQKAEKREERGEARAEAEEVEEIKLHDLER